MARILFGDDDREQLHIFQLLLESQGHELLLAAAPCEVLDWIEKAPPDLLIVDLRFPSYEEGRALLRDIRESGCGTPIIVLSGWPDEIQGAPEEKLVNLLMTKPARVPDLLRAIAELTR